MAKFYNWMMVLHARQFGLCVWKYRFHAWCAKFHNVLQFHGTKAGYMAVAAEVFLSMSERPDFMMKGQNSCLQGLKPCVEDMFHDCMQPTMLREFISTLESHIQCRGPGFIPEGEGKGRSILCLQGQIPCFENQVPMSGRLFPGLKNQVWSLGCLVS